MYIDAIENAIKGAGSIETYVRTLALSERFLTEEDKRVRESVERIMDKDGNATEFLINNVINDVINSIPMGNVLAKNIIEAAAINTEFMNDMLLAPLLSVSSDANNFSVVISRSRWKSTVGVIVDMDSTAGTLGEYASGVTKVREKLEAERTMRLSTTRSKKAMKAIGSRPRDPIKASHYWKNRIYNNVNQAWYSDTMEERIRLSSKPAPYWKLLDSGSISMASDWGGISYPSGSATDFTGKTASTITKLFRDGMKLSEIDFKKFADRVMERQRILFDSLDRIYERTDIVVNTDITVVNNLIAQYGNDLDVDKLKTVLDSIVRGETIKTTAAGRIELTARGGHTKRVRPSLRSLVAGIR